MTRRDTIYTLANTVFCLHMYVVFKKDNYKEKSQSRDETLQFFPVANYWSRDE